MENVGSSEGAEWWLYVLLFRNRGLLDSQDIFAVLGQWPLYVALLIAAVLASWLMPGGCAWAGRHRRSDHVPIPSPKGWPIIRSLMDMSIGLAHRKLEYLACLHGAMKLMAFSLGSTPAVIKSDPEVARELLNSPHFANRPLKQSAQQLLFGQAIGFAPNGDYWRLLRRISSTHLFSPRRIAAHEPGRQADALGMLVDIQKECECNGVVRVRAHLQGAALNNIMGSVFGRRFDMSCTSTCEEVKELWEMVDEGFQLLGAFNWADHLPWLRPLDPLRIHARCARLVPREIIFCGTDTTTLLTEWTMAELVLNPDAQKKAQAELDAVVGRERSVKDSNIPNLPYVQAVVKEALRMHPPGPLLSWACLCTEGVNMGDGMCVLAGMTAMVNMWSITHDPSIWESPQEFRP
eukprot:PITA_11628